MSQKSTMTFIGVLFLLAGLLALLFPGIASYTSEQFIGWLFLIIGVMQAYSAFRSSEKRGRVWILLGGVVAIVIGVAFISKPILGMEILTILIALLFIGSGFLKVYIAFPLKNTSLFWPLLISGAISVILAIMIIGEFPASAFELLGILLGIELLSNGLAIITLARNHE